MQNLVTFASLLVAAIACCALADSSQQEQLVEKLVSSDIQMMSPVESGELLRKLDEDHFIGGQIRVSKLLELEKNEDCNKEALIGLKSLVQLAGFLFKKRNSLTDYLAEWEQKRYLKCGHNLASLGNPSESLNMAELENTNDLVKQLASIPARELLNGAFAKEQSFKECHKARDLLEPFYLILEGAKKYNLADVLANEQLIKWSKIFVNCDRILYLANPYDLRW